MRLDTSGHLGYLGGSGLVLCCRQSLEQLFHCSQQLTAGEGQLYLSLQVVGG